MVMLATKFSFIRCRILDKCFRNPIRHYQIRDLIDACEDELQMSISRRTIYNDIDFMKSNDGWGAPIDTIKDGNRRYYYYTVPGFSIDKMPLTEAQLKQIQSAVDLLNSFDGLPQFDGLQDSLAKLGLTALNTDVKPCFGLDHNEYVGGLSYLTPLFNAIQYNTVLKIGYKPFEEEAMDLVFHPHYLKQYNNRWYIFGVEQNHSDQIWNLGLDRIESIEATKDYPYIQLDINWNEYFDDIIGVTNLENAPIETIHFLVHDKTAHYLYTKPLHGSQHNKWVDDNTLDVTLKVKINFELTRTLLSYAPFITILEPQSLVEEHKKMLEKALGQYQL